MNPFDPTIAAERDATSPTLGRHLLAAFPLILPIAALASVIAVVALERDLGMNGAVLGSFSTPLGILFTISAFMVLGSFAWIPAGFATTFLFALRIPGGRAWIVYPVIFVMLCSFCVAFVLLDIDGMFTYYMD